MKQFRIHLTALIFVVMALEPISAFSQPTDMEIGDMATFLVLFPELRNASAPEWVVPGARVSYQFAGGGAIQYDVVSSDANQVLAYGHMYADIGAGLMQSSTAAGVGLPGVGPFWINPSVLDNAEDLTTNELSINRYEKAVGNQNLIVVRFQTTTANGQTVYEIDTASGALVFTSISTPNSAAQMTLVDMRSLNLPWDPDRAPNWARVDAELDYSGTKSTTVQSAGTYQQPVSAKATIRRAGARWSILQLNYTTPGMQNESAGAVSGVGQLGGAFWIPRQALSSTIPNEPMLIDQDPVTDASMYLVREADGTILLQQVLPASRYTWIYNPTIGVLERMIQEVQTPTSYEVTDLSRSGGSDLAALNQMSELPDDPSPDTPSAPSNGNENNSTGGDNGSTGNTNPSEPVAGPGVFTPPTGSGTLGSGFEPPPSPPNASNDENEGPIVVVNPDESSCSTRPGHLPSPAGQLGLLISFLFFVTARSRGVRA